MLPKPYVFLIGNSEKVAAWAPQFADQYECHSAPHIVGAVEYMHKHGMTGTNMMFVIDHDVTTFPGHKSQLPDVPGIEGLGEKLRSLRLLSWEVFTPEAIRLLRKTGKISVGSGVYIVDEKKKHYDHVPEGVSGIIDPGCPMVEQIIPSLTIGLQDMQRKQNPLTI